MLKYERRTIAVLSWIVAILLAGCQHFVQVTSTRAGAGGELQPVFSWPGDAVASGLTVRAVLEDCDFEGAPASDDAVWWHITGEIRSPVTYGVVPPGAFETVPARPLTSACDDWIVTVTDQTMRGESTKF